MTMENFEIHYKEPCDGTPGVLVVRANNAAHAKAYFRWIHALGAQQLKAYPTKSEPNYIADYTMAEITRKRQGY